MAKKVELRESTRHCKTFPKTSIVYYYLIKKFLGAVCQHRKRGGFCAQIQRGDSACSYEHSARGQFRLPFFETLSNLKKYHKLD